MVLTLLGRLNKNMRDQSQPGTDGIPKVLPTVLNHYTTCPGPVCATISMTFQNNHFKWKILSYEMKELKWATSK